MRLRHIEIFHAVYVTGSVSQAAKSLNVSQPTVSKVLKHAEDQLGFLLFHRERGRLFPTEKADLLIKQVTPVFDQINELRKYSAMLKSTNIGRLRLAMTPAFSLQAVPRALSNFVNLFPDIPVEIETQHASEIVKLLNNNTVDIGVVFEAPALPGLKSIEIGETEFVCVSPAAHDLKKKKLRLKDLANLPLIRLNAKSPLGRKLNTILEQIDIQVTGNNIVAETYHLAKRLVEQGTGVAVIDKITAFSGNRQNLNFHEVEDLPTIKIDAIVRADDPIVSFKSKFIEILKDEISNNYLQ